MAIQYIINQYTGEWDAIFDDDDEGNIVAGNGLSRVDDTLHVNIGDGIEISSDNLTIDLSNDSGLQFTSGALDLELAGSTLEKSASGLSVQGLPPLFEINGIAVGSNVTSSNLDTLTGGNNADSLHIHNLSNLSGDADDIDESATRKWAAESGADVTANNTAAAITDQGDLATKDSVDLATSEVTNKTLSNLSGDLDDISDGTTYSKVTSATLNGNNVDLASANATGDIDANSNRIINLTDPSSAQDAATKSYVDDQVTTGGNVVTTEEDPLPDPDTVPSGLVFRSGDKMYRRWDETLEEMTINTSPYGYWKVDETSGTTASNETANEDGTYTGTYSLEADPLVPDGGNSLEVSSSDGHLYITPSGLSSVDKAALSMWFQAENSSGNKQVFFTARGSADSARLILEKDTSDDIEIETADATNINTGLSVDELLDGYRHHVLLQYDSTANTIELWLDGYLRFEKTDTALSGSQDLAKVAFGGSYLGGGTSGLGRSANAYVDECSIWGDVFLTSAQIKALHNRGRHVDTRFEQLTQDVAPGGANAFKHTWFQGRQNGNKTYNDGAERMKLDPETVHYDFGGNFDFDELEYVVPEDGWYEGLAQGRFRSGLGTGTKRVRWRVETSGSLDYDLAEESGGQGSSASSQGYQCKLPRIPLRAGDKVYAQLSHTSGSGSYTVGGRGAGGSFIFQRTWCEIYKVADL